MPGMDGVECLERIKSSYPQLPVILMSGYWDETAGGRVSKSDIAGFLQKPFTNRDLAEVLQKAKDFS